VLAKQTAQHQVELVRQVPLDAAADVELEAVSRDPAELAPPAGLGVGPQGDAAARSAGLLQPDEEPPAVLPDELERLGGCDHLHEAIVANPRSATTVRPDRISAAPLGLRQHPRAAVPVRRHASREATQRDVELLGQHPEALRYVDLELVGRHAAESTLPSGLRRGLEDRAAAPSAEGLGPDEEASASLPQMGKGLGARHDAHAPTMLRPRILRVS
jgi:hypothetical protein